MQISKVLKDWNDTWEGWLSKDSHNSVDKENEITASHPSFAVMANIFNSFCKAHNVQGWFTLHTQERCDTMISYVVNVYAKDFAWAPDGYLQQILKLINIATILVYDGM